MTVEPTDELAQLASLPDWSVPEVLTPAVLDPFRQEGRIWLATAINLMTFGIAEVPEPETLIDVAKKGKSAKALFDVARRGQVSLAGDTRRGGDGSDPIPAAYFDTPRNLGHDDNSIETDLNETVWTSFISAREKHHLSWFNVRVNGPEFFDWISSRLPDRAALNTARRESDAIKALTGLLRNDGRLTRVQAIAHLRDLGLELTNRGFQQRVWPKARQEAGLAERAPPGRKPKSSR